MTIRSKGRILVADCQPGFSGGVSEILSREGYDVIPAGTVEHAGKIIHHGDIDAVITDLGLSNSDGMRLFEIITAAETGIPVIVLTARETVEFAVAAMTRGAFYYLVKPPDYSQLKSILTRAVEQRKLKKEIELLKNRLSQSAPRYRIIGTTPEMLKTLEVIEAVRELRSSVLISGEPGTGKELIARTLHYRSTRRAAPFIAVNCAAIPAEFLEVELFGRVKGGLTGGAAHRRGKLEEAGDGVIFLDEIGRLGPRTHAKLLQLLRDGHMERTGGNERMKIRFRLISTTLEDLWERVMRDSFSGDLYRRINEIEIKIPPLRERKEDIPLLASAFLDEFCIKQNRKVMISSEVMRVFHDHDWPGNVRQLRNVVERAVILAQGNKITLRELPGEFSAPKRQTPNRHPVRTLKQLEMLAIRETLRKCNGNKSRTARMLGISRKAFYKRLKETDQFLKP